jgi:hypothetical protein
MTTTEITDLLQRNPALADKVLQGLSDDKKYVFTRSFAISCNEPFDPILRTRIINLSSTRQHQLLGEAIVWLRHPSRIRIITAFQRRQRRMGMPLYRAWDRIVAHVQKVTNPILQKQAKKIEDN